MTTTFQSFIRYAAILPMLYGCAGVTPTQTSNLIERSGIEITNYKFYQVANPSDFFNCVKPLKEMCENREMAAGKQFDALQFSVSIRDSGTSRHTSSVSDFSMYLAGAVARDNGYKFYTTLNVIDIGDCSSSPSAHTYGSVDSNGNYSGTTYLNQNSACINLYTVKYLAFNEYDPIKNGILVDYSSDRKPALSYDLYFNAWDQIRAFKSGSKSAQEYYMSHPIDPWKYYFPSVQTVETIADKYSTTSNPDIASVTKLPSASSSNKGVREQLMILPK